MNNKIFKIEKKLGLKFKNSLLLKQALIHKSKNSESNNERLIIAYEPIWAIGTDLTPTIKEISDIHNFIKKDILGFEDYKVIYGGSVNSSNSKEILSIENVDGVLVGGASVNIEEFNRIIAS